MNTLRKIVFPSVITAASLILLAHSSFASSAPIDEEVVKMGHSFELSRGDHLTLAHRHTPATYRVCIEEVPGVVPLEVSVDGRKMEVLDGTCTDVVGAHVSVRPSNKLPRDKEMMGHFEWVKK